MPKLYFFDIDETVFHTYAKVFVRNANSDIVCELDNRDFNKYVLGSGEYFDFIQFSDSRLFFDTSRPILPVLEIIHKISDDIKSGARPDDMVVFLTARPNFDNKNLFKDSFRDVGIPIDDVRHFYIERTGNLKSMTVPERKVNIVLSYLADIMPSDVYMYDDDESNLRLFLGLKLREPDFNYHAFSVGADESITEYRV